MSTTTRAAAAVDSNLADLSAEVAFTASAQNDMVEHALVVEDVTRALKEAASTWVDERGATLTVSGEHVITSNRSRNVVREIRRLDAVRVPTHTKFPIRLSTQIKDAAWAAGLDETDLRDIIEFAEFRRAGAARREVLVRGNVGMIVVAGVATTLLDAAEVDAHVNGLPIEEFTMTGGMYRYAAFVPGVSVEQISDIALYPDWTFDTLDGNSVHVRDDEALIINAATGTILRHGPADEIVNSRLPVTVDGVTMTSRVAFLTDVLGTSTQAIADAVNSPLDTWRGDRGLTMLRGENFTVATRHASNLVVAVLDNVSAEKARTESYIGGHYVFEKIRDRIAGGFLDRDRLAEALSNPTATRMNEYGNEVRTGAGYEVTVLPTGEAKWVDILDDEPVAATPVTVKRQPFPAALRPKMAA